MIAFDGVSQEEMEAMCTPMHRILLPAPASSSESAPSPPTNTTSPKHGNGNERLTGALYLGSMAAVQDLDLRAHGITNLVQVLEVPWMPRPDDDAGLACYQIDIKDCSSAVLQPHLDAACNYIRTSLARGDNVLVHCQQGVSRSASIVIAYLIREHSMTYDTAFDLVKRQRQCIKPNPGFVKTLREWESTCKAPRPASR
ncbi:Phosphatases II [Mycena venus]|uniref:protein-tyrosine-phosphatase n=1 Tax=Mycena venus TaxID=2733690 RepID=A0A8H6YJL0_9AGAR|nr:Phosphatases II [Mycena venus]